MKATVILRTGDGYITEEWDVDPRRDLPIPVPLSAVERDGKEYALASIVYIYHETS